MPVEHGEEWEIAHNRGCYREGLVPWKCKGVGSVGEEGNGNEDAEAKSEAGCSGDVLHPNRNRLILQGFVGDSRDLTAGELRTSPEGECLPIQKRRVAVQ